MAGSRVINERLLSQLNLLSTAGLRRAWPLRPSPLARPFTTSPQHLTIKHAPSIPTHEAIAMDYDLCGGGSPPLAASSGKRGGLPPPEAFVICHGYLASRQSWRHIAKALSPQHRLPAYALDMRNHGTSPHTPSMTYADMVSDLMKFFHDHQLKNVALVGHSMGAKAAMLFALHPGLPPDALKYVISIDTPPYARPLRPQFSGYLDCLAEIHQKQITSMDEADAILKPVATNPKIRRMLEMNLHSSDPTQPLQCRIPIEVIKAHINDLASFPLLRRQDGKEPAWPGKTLFIQAQKDNRIDKRGVTNCNIATVNIGHHGHLDSPLDIIRVIDDFFAGKDVSQLWKPQPKTKDGVKRKKWLKKVEEEQQNMQQVHAELPPKWKDDDVKKTQEENEKQAERTTAQT